MDCAPDAPPAYMRDFIKPEWKIRNARYRSSFRSKEQPEISDFRQHLECMKDTFLDTTWGIGCPTGPRNEEHQALAVEYSQAFDDVSHLICEYQACLQKIKPLLEEDILLLLLSRYAQTTGVGVYIEIRRPGNVQIYDSDLSEPHTMGIQDQLPYASGVLNAKFPHKSFETSPPASNVESTQMHPVSIRESSVTVNFPAMHLTCPTDVRGVNQPPAYHDPPQQKTVLSTRNSSEMPEKLYPPTFEIHRCHHPGVEHSGCVNALEIPFGLPEVVQHLSESPEPFYHVGFHVGNRSHESYPINDGGLQAFKCHLTQSDAWVYVTVKRTGDFLAYNCFKDEKVWAACHPEHEECQNCL